MILLLCNEYEQQKTEKMLRFDNNRICSDSASSNYIFNGACVFY